MTGTGIIQSDVFVWWNVGKFLLGIWSLERLFPLLSFWAPEFPSCLDGVPHATLSILVMVVVTFGFV